MTVAVEISVHNLDLNDRLREYATKKASKLDRYLDILEEAKVDLAYDKSARSSADRQVAQLTVRGKGVMLRAEERTDDIYASIDAVMEKMYRQVERYRGRHWRGRGDGRTAAEAGADPEAEPLEIQHTISRRKSFPLSPMDEDEAVEQMELIGHTDFFVFLNTSSNAVNVLYRRRDGTLGLIETEVA
ncbi:MAG: ribosome-associated translation inhibitor RaiA [Anaerolineales bacterium]|nr:ribosome-associated translation inhibitor RaiA [Anaerolineales bacterium]